MQALSRVFAQEEGDTIIARKCHAEYVCERVMPLTVMPHTSMSHGTHIYTSRVYKQGLTAPAYTHVTPAYTHVISRGGNHDSS